jgi:hypothetical protein
MGIIAFCDVEPYILVDIYYLLEELLFSIWKWKFIMSFEAYVYSFLIGFPFYGINFEVIGEQNSFPENLPNSVSFP